ncbi:MAG: hypothetical protein AAF471_07985 [Myxococcota bacterium]
MTTLSPNKRRSPLAVVAATLLAICVGIALYIRGLGGQMPFEPLDYADAKKVLKEAYTSDLLPFQLPDEETDAIESANDSSNRLSHVYGEITFAGADNLIDELNPTKQDVFVDLGSGRGRLVTHLALRSPVRKALGIELSQMRYDESVRALDRIKEQDITDAKGNPLDLRRIEFIQGDILKSDLSETDIIYACSTLFPKKLMEGILQKALAIPRSVTLVSLKRYPKHPRLHHAKTLIVPTTWHLNVPVYIYKTIPTDKQLPGMPGGNQLAPRKLEVKYVLDNNYMRMSGFGQLAPEDQQRFKAAGGNPSLYGEISFEGVDMLLTKLNPGPRDAIYFAGDGLGKEAMQTYLATGVKKVVGVELSQARHNLATVAKTKLEKDDQKWMTAGRTLEFRQGDPAKIDLNDATILVAVQRYLSESQLRALRDKALRLPRTVKIITVKKLPGHGRLREAENLTISVPTSWKDSVPLYIYETVPVK